MVNSTLVHAFSLGMHAISCHGSDIWMPFRSTFPNLGLVITKLQVLINCTVQHDRNKIELSSLVETLNALIVTKG